MANNSIFLLCGVVRKNLIIDACHVILGPIARCISPGDRAKKLHSVLFWPGQVWMRRRIAQTSVSVSRLPQPQEQDGCRTFAIAGY